MTAAIDIEIAEMITRRRRRQSLGYSYYETNHARTPEHRTATKPRLNKSRAGQPNWRHRPNKPEWLAAELDILEQTLTVALVAIDFLEARRAA